MAAQKATDEKNSLGQAYLKYMDALALDEAKAVYNFHVGRLLVIQGNFNEAVKRLEVTLNWNPQYQMGR
jgi:predicted negative regulator of RcsB-dependent stress response